MQSICSVLGDFRIDGNVNLVTSFKVQIEKRKKEVIELLKINPKLSKKVKTKVSRKSPISMTKVVCQDASFEISN